jgi:hypothetical protein
LRLHCLVAPQRHLCPFSAVKNIAATPASASAPALVARRKRLQSQRQLTTMNVLLSPQPPVFPHQHENPRLSPSRSRKFSSIVIFLTGLALCSALLDDFNVGLVSMTPPHT